MARAPARHAGGRGFEPRHPRHTSIMTFSIKEVQWQGSEPTIPWETARGATTSRQDRSGQMTTWGAAIAIPKGSSRIGSRGEFVSDSSRDPIRRSPNNYV